MLVVSVVAVAMNYAGVVAGIDIQGRGVLDDRVTLVRVTRCNGLRLERRVTLPSDAARPTRFASGSLDGKGRKKFPLTATWAFCWLR